MGIVAEDKPGLRDNAHSSLMTAVAVRSQNMLLLPYKNQI